MYFIKNVSNWIPRNLQTRSSLLFSIFASSVLITYIILSDSILWPLGLTRSGKSISIGHIEQNRKVLRFTKDATFQISVFADLHFGEAEDLDWGPIQDINTKRAMNEVLSFESPQLVVLNGDLITGENTYVSNSSLYVDQLLEPLVQRDLYWASTYGNHDSDVNLSRNAIFEREKQYPKSLTRSMVHQKQAGISNYYLPVFSADESNDIPLMILWFFDSRGGNEFQQQDDYGNAVSIENWVHKSVSDDDYNPIPLVILLTVKVVQWFTETNKQLKQRYGKSIPSLAFYHIPVNAMLAFQSTGVNPETEPGINDDIPLAQQAVASIKGPSGEVDTYYTGDDIPFMDAMLKTEGLLATFSGHDHGDDWCFKWNSTLPGMNLTGNGINLCFGRHSGYGGYGRWTRGARQILLAERTLGKEFKTWNRLENGTISGDITLNITYGKDRYVD